MGQGSSEQDTQQDGTIRDKLRAWWQGDELRPLMEAVPQAVGGDEADAAPTPEELPPGWTPERIRAAAWLYGEGATTVGNAAFQRDMLVPLGLNEKHSVAELGSGLGVAARFVAHELGAYVDSFEPDGCLADEQERLNKAAGLGRKVTLHRGRIVGAKLRPASRDAFFGREALLFEEHREVAAGALKAAMRPGGQLLLVEILRKTANRKLPAELATFVKTEGQERPLTLDSLRDMRELLMSLGFDVRIVEDLTEGYCAGAMDALKQLMALLKRRKPPPPLRPWVIRETEQLARKVIALRSGEIGMYRIYARLPELDPFAKH